jgi:tetratricopeptide (TPR) repeat protein
MNPKDAELIRRSMLAQQFEHSLVSDREKENKKNAELIEKADQEKKSFEQGYHLFIEEMEKHSSDDTFACGEDTAPVAKESFKISSEASISTSSLDFWKNYSEHPTPLRDFLDYSDDLLLNLYNDATFLYGNKQYREAIIGYKFLCLMDPSVSSFWIGLGLALEVNDEPAEGMQAFEKGIETSSSEFTPYLGVIRCSKKLHDFKRTIELLSQAKEDPLLEKEAKASLEYIASIQNRR